MEKKKSGLPESNSTERQILEAAKRVFGRKGMDGARMQEIADEAGLNKALLHYYFRTKEKLFQAVFKEVFQSFFPKVGIIMFGQEIPITERIKKFVHEYIQLLQNHPYLPGFIAQQMHSEPYDAESLISVFRSAGIRPEKFFEAVEKEVDLGNIRQVDPVHLILNIISLCVFPFIGRPVISALLLPGKDYDLFLEERKEHISHFIIQAISKT